MQGIDGCHSFGSVNRLSMDNLAAVCLLHLLGSQGIPFALVPSDGVFGRFDLATLCGCHTLIVCLLSSRPGGLEGVARANSTHCIQFCTGSPCAARAESLSLLRQDESDGGLVFPAVF
jgi:hypothetical protein